MTRYMVLKEGMHLATASTPEEADKLYLEYDADEIREYEDDAWLGIIEDK